MNRIGSALGWAVLGWVGGAIIGAVAAFILGVFRGEAVLQAALAGAGPVGLIGALGAFSGRLLERPSQGSGDRVTNAETSQENEDTAWFATFFGALLGAFAGATIGKALGADVWLLDSLAQLEAASLQASLHYHIGLFGGPHVVAGAFVGILAFGSLEVFLGSESSFNFLVIAALLMPVVAVFSALIGQIDWGTAIIIVVATVAIFLLMSISGGGSPMKIK